MRFPSEYFFSRVLTFHSTSAGGFLEPPPKYMSYSIFSRRSWSSNTESSSSMANAAAPFRGGRSSRTELLKIQHPARPNRSNQAEYTIDYLSLLRAQGTGAFCRFLSRQAKFFVAKSGSDPCIPL